MIDPWLSIDIAQSFANSTPNTNLIKLNNVGHYPQEHYHESILQDMLPFVRLSVGYRGNVKNNICEFNSNSSGKNIVIVESGNFICQELISK